MGEVRQQRGRAVLEKGTPYLHMNTRSSQPLLQLTWQWQVRVGGAVYAGPPQAQNWVNY